MATSDVKKFRERNLPHEMQILARWEGARTPIASIVCVTFNQVQYIEDAIRGFLQQRTSFPFEILIQDDESSDGTRELVAHYASQYPQIIKPIFPRENLYRRGIKPTFHAVGFSHAPFIALCEGDDYWVDPEKLQKQIDEIDSDSNIMLVHSAGFRQDQFGIRRLDYCGAHDFDDRPSSAAALMTQNCVITATAVYRRCVFDALQDGGLLDTRWPFGDYPLALQAIAMGSVVKLQDATAVYRESPGSLTNRDRMAHFRMHSAAHECRTVFSKLMPLDADTLSDLLMASAQETIKAAALTGDEEAYKLAKRMHTKAFRKLSPQARMNLEALNLFPMYRLARRIARRQLKRLMVRNDH